MTIKDIREKNNLSQKEFAKRIGKSQSAVCMWEKGITKPRTNELNNIAIILNISIAELISLITD